MLAGIINSRISNGDTFNLTPKTNRCFHILGLDIYCLIDL